MSLSNRRSVMLGVSMILLGTAGGCGFRPAYRDGGAADGLINEISLQEAVDPESFAFRERMRRRLGHTAEKATYSLSFRLAMDEDPVAINPAADVTRYQIVATVDWRLVRLRDGTVVSEGRIKTNGAYDATAAPFATRSAQKSERAELATELAELTATRLLTADLNS